MLSRGAAALSLSFALPALAAGVANSATGAPALVADYHLSARLDPPNRRIDASGELRWRNPSRVAAERLCFHLYLNAFRSPRTSFVRGAEPWVAEQLGDEGPGSLELTTLREVGGGDLRSRLQFAAPDDGNPEDATVAWLPLDEPIPPGGERSFDLAWTAHLPPLVDRAGLLDDFAMVAQWYPKVALRRADGSWSCHQFNSVSEFSADFGDYRVELDVPAGWEIGASGRAEQAPSEAAGRRRQTFVASGVHDFAWSASPSWSVRRAALPRSGPASRPAVELHLLLQEPSRRATSRIVETLAYGLARYEELYGPYPHATLTVVEPPPGGESATAMEYPALFTMMVSPLPGRSLELENTVLHELAHQWWQGVVATDEAEEPFLDEGLASYSTARLVAERWHGQPPGLRLLGWSLPLPGSPLDPFDSMRLASRSALQIDPVGRTAWGFRDAEAYGALVYDEAALALRQLERWIGRERFDAALARFATRGRFAHPTAADLVADLSFAAGEDLSELWHELMRRSGPVDYAVVEATTRTRLAPTESAPKEDEEFGSTVVVERRGEKRLPVEIELVFADGTRQRAHWDGRTEWVRVRAVGPPLVEARVDPERRLLLDIDRLNDSRRVELDARPHRAVAQGLRWLLQLLLEALADFA